MPGFRDASIYPLDGPDARWLDVCSGPGGKAALLAGLAQERGAHLVAGEIAVSLMLLGGAGLMMRSLARLGAVDPGFEPRNVVTMRLILTGSPNAAPERRSVFYRQALERVVAVPGVESASGINHLPLAGDLWTFTFVVEGLPAPPP